ncbi:MAG: DUF494 family protein [Neisseriaceae bacterium]|nr:DUF494 family protein [Neisseriaceae bacterium]
MSNTTPMFDVFLSLLEHFQNDEGTPTRESILECLINEGYDSYAIGCAINCMNTLFYQYAWTSESVNLPKMRSIRVFDTQEQSTLPTDVRGLLYSLGRTGEISLSDCEFITNALMNLPHEEITVDNAKLLTLIRLGDRSERLPDNLNESLFSVFDDRNVDRGIFH